MVFDNPKKNRLKIAKHYWLVIITSFLCFVGSLIGFNLLNNTSNASTDIFEFSSMLIGIFVTVMFFLVCFSVFIGTFISFFNIFKVQKGTKYWKIFATIFIIFMVVFAILTITFYFIYLVDLIKANINWKFGSSSWLNNIANYYNSNIGGPNNYHYILIFVFSILWSIFAILFNSAFNVLGNFVKNDVHNSNKNSNNLIYENTTSNNKTTNENINIDSIESFGDNNINKKTLEDDWLNSSSSDLNQLTENNLKEQNKIIDENDPNSIFD